MQKFSVQILVLPYLLLALCLEAQPITLRAAADRVNLNFGMAINNQINNGDQAAMNIIKSQCNILVNENSMKFGSVEPTRSKFNFSAPLKVVEFAEANGIKMRGHTLLWDSQIGYASSLSSGREDVLKAIKTHIDSTVGFFKGRIKEWDVVNEPFIAAESSTTLRNSVWVRNIGPDFIDSALVYAHRADPDAKLFINDFWVEWSNPKSTALYNLVKTLKQKGIPIHGVGFQCHTGNNISKADLSANIKRFGDLGILVSLTEVDVHRSGSQPSGWKSLMEACMENANCVSFLTWGVDDAHSWLTKPDDNCDCLLYDGQLQPKANNISTLITAMNQSNPTISAARKVYQNGSGVSLLKLPRNQKSNLNLISNGIKYKLDAAANINLKAFDISGNKIATLVNTRQNMGEHSIIWDEKKFLPGLYFLLLQINEKQEITKIVIKK